MVSEIFVYISQHQRKMRALHFHGIGRKIRWFATKLGNIEWRRIRKKRLLDICHEQ